MLDKFPQRDFGLWVFMRTTNVCLFCDHLYCTGYHAQGYHAQGYHAQGYHVLTTTARLPRRGLPRPIPTTTGYHACVYIPISTPELPRSKQTSGYRQVITPAGSFYLFFLSSVIRQCSTTTTTSPPSLAHIARTHSTIYIYIFDTTQPQPNRDGRKLMCYIANKRGLPFGVLCASAVPRTRGLADVQYISCLLYTSPSPRDGLLSRMPSSA